MNCYNIVGLTSLGLSTILWIAPVFNNNNLFPETRVCFRAKQILNKENKGLLRCDSNSRVGIILTSIFNDLDKRDIEFSGKVASNSITQHFDSNLSQTKHFQLFSISLGIVALSCFSKSEQDRKANRNRSYHGRRKEYVSNEMVVDDYLYPVDHHAIATNKVIAKKGLQLSFSESDKTISENELQTAKNYKELAKIRGTEQQDTSENETFTGNLEEEKQTLIEALKSHEDGWLWYLVQSFTPIIIYGKAGSYKSYSAATIALLKHYLIDAKIESIADVDFNQNRNDSWKYLVLLEPCIYGAGIDWDDYGNAYLDAIERSKTRTLKDSPIISIWDELTNAKGKFDNAPNIIPFVIATPRKRNEHCILISHGLTQDNLGGCESISEPIKTQTYRLNLKTNPTGKPLFKGTLNGLVDEEGEELEDKKVTLPSWFRPELIHGHFNDSPINFDN